MPPITANYLSVLKVNENMTLLEWMDLNRTNILRVLILSIWVYGSMPSFKTEIEGVGKLSSFIKNNNDENKQRLEGSIYILAKKVNSVIPANEIAVFLTPVSKPAYFVSKMNYNVFPIKIVPMNSLESKSIEDVAKWSYIISYVPRGYPITSLDYRLSTSSLFDKIYYKIAKTGHQAIYHNKGFH